MTDKTFKTFKDGLNKMVDSSILLCDYKIISQHYEITHIGISVGEVNVAKKIILMTNSNYINNKYRQAVNNFININKKKLL